MRTIAVTIDEATLDRVDELTASSDRYSSRSALVRAALSGYVARERRRREEDRERRIIREHKEALADELTALVAEQAPT
ncbi:MAG: ribbon-helix-helix protein, CopG family [Holophagales bacterium]|nr:ribbon-helix-helix protein, CopG family [Holophagales bacterium]MXX61957.1 ribbon-helix-helix protein, CopG family [Holophagales bacterium]MYB19839.1 ribbon-helix-helix protein, CopG family [Holophagales bacterium]MYC09008.1 ribbon-helix-helix protein, CopG family [Holophagales bacterium]MYD22813.1 ribbon-helix-helix protein, CopG family [Holophagales bacterium]